MDHRSINTAGSSNPEQDRETMDLMSRKTDAATSCSQTKGERFGREAGKELHDASEKIDAAARRTEAKAERVRNDAKENLHNTSEKIKEGVAKATDKMKEGVAAAAGKVAETANRLKEKMRS
ncbi:MAG TPA: hypothetical protein DCW71_05580 [Alistipes sp.]|nr:hypothetical protein [Alistipes sp.]